MGRTRERGHVRLHKGYWWGILPTMTREDGPSVRPWFKPEENTEAAAEVLLARKLVELDENRLPAPTADTVAGWIEQFLAHHDVEPSTLSGYRQALRRRIEHPTIGIGRIKLQKLTAVRLDRYYRDLKDEGYAKATIQQTHRLLSVALKEAVRKRKLSYSPVPGATLPRFERRSRKALLVDRKKLWTPSELYEGDPKSESSIREITIDDHTVQVLRDWREVKRRDRRAAREALGGLGLRVHRRDRPRHPPRAAEPQLHQRAVGAERGAIGGVRRLA
jgi:hypothetical protein